MYLHWVHLSDIHYTFKNFDTEVLREKLIDELIKINSRNRIDFIFITGDFTSRNKSYSEDLKNFISQILLKVNLSKANLFIVPGNHDLDREQEGRKELLSYIYQQDNPADIFNNLKEEQFKILINSQNAFYNLYNEIKGEKYQEDDVHFLKPLDEKKTNIIHINTSWLCFENRKVFLGMDRLRKCFETLDKDYFNIVIGHHPEAEMDSQQRLHLTELFKEFKIDMYLNGHSHKPGFEHGKNYISCTCGQSKSDAYTGSFVEGIVDFESECTAKYIYYHFDNRLLKWKVNRDVHGAGKMEYFELNVLNDIIKVGDYSDKNNIKIFSRNQIKEVFTAIDQNDTIPESSEKLIINFDNGIINRANVRHILLRQNTLLDLLHCIEAENLEKSGLKIGQDASKVLMDTLEGKYLPQNFDVFISLWNHWDKTGGWGEYQFYKSKTDDNSYKFRVNNDFLYEDLDERKLFNFWVGYIKGFINYFLSEINEVALRELESDELEKYEMPLYGKVNIVEVEREIVRENKKNASTLFTVSFEKVLYKNLMNIFNSYNECIENKDFPNAEAFCLKILKYIKISNYFEEIFNTDDQVKIGQFLNWNTAATIKYIKAHQDENKKFLFELINEIGQAENLIMMGGV